MAARRYLPSLFPRASDNFPRHIWPLFYIPLSCSRSAEPKKGREKEKKTKKEKENDPTCNEMQRRCCTLATSNGVPESLHLKGKNWLYEWDDLINKKSELKSGFHRGTPYFILKFIFIVSLSRGNNVFIWIFSFFSLFIVSFPFVASSRRYSW